MIRTISRKPIIVLTVMLVVSMVLAACGAQATPTPVPTKAPASQPTAAPQPTQAPSAEPIKVGLIAPMSGTNAILGEWEKKSISIAIDELNAAGGINGRPIELLIEDDEADPTKSVSLAQKLITQDGIVACFATPNSTPTLALVPVFEKYKVPHLCGALNDGITKTGSKFTFRNTPPGSAYETTVVNFLVKKGYSKFAIISDTSAYGKGQGDYQEAALTANGLQALTRESYGIEDKDFTGQLTKILATNPEVLLIAGSEVAAGLIAKQSRQLGFTGQIAGGAAVGTTKFVEVAEDAAEGAFYATPYPSNDLNDMARAFAAKYTARWGDEPENHGAKGYDQTQLLILALKNAYPNITGETIADELHKICGYQGLQGEFCFDETGEGIKECFIGVVKDGKLVAYTE